MANARKKISELTALTSASLDTTVLGVDNGTTYKIELDTLADAVALRVNILDRDRLESLESASGSYLTSLNGTISGSSQLTSSYDARYVVSGSLTQTTWDNISGKPIGLVSQSTDISSLNSFTQSQDILNTAFTNGMNARLQTSSFNEFSASIHTQILAATNEQSFNGLISSSVQITNLGFVTGSYATINEYNSLTQSFNLISGSVVNLQSGFDTGSYNSFTASYYTDSASFNSRIISATNEQDLSGLNSFTASQSILNTAFNNGISARLQTSSFNEFSTSVDSRIIAATNEQSFNGLISGSSQLTSSYDTRYALSASFVSSSNVSSIQTITSASYAALTPVSGTLYIIIG